MSEKPISPQRQRMLEDMSVRRFTADTQREYIRAVKRLAAQGRHRLRVDSAQSFGCSAIAAG